MNKPKKGNTMVEQKEKLAREAAKLADLWRDLDDEEPFTPANRYEYPAPAATDKTKYNPNHMVDIEMFIKHPYYLNLNPYPWQILALKLFYAGSEGNSHVKINESKKEEETGCDNCVWKYVKENECAVAEANEQGDHIPTILNSLNSRCLRCSRCPTQVRNARFKYEIDECMKSTWKKSFEDFSRKNRRIYTNLS